MRLFNTVGPRQTGQYGMVVPNFVRQALAGQPITVYGDGTQRAASATSATSCARSPTSWSATTSTARCSTSAPTEEISIRELAERVRDADRLGVRDRATCPTSEAYEEGFEDMPRRIPDITKIKDALGWAPTKRLDEILDDVVASQRATAAV